MNPKEQNRKVGHVKWVFCFHFSDNNFSQMAEPGEEVYLRWFKGAQFVWWQCEQKHFLWQYPEGYLEAQKEKEEAAGKEESDSDQNDATRTKKNKNKKRKRSLDSEAEVRCGHLSIILNLLF